MTIPIPYSMGQEINEAVGLLRAAGFTGSLLEMVREMLRDEERAQWLQRSGTGPYQMLRALTDKNRDAIRAIEAALGVEFKGIDPPWWEQAARRISVQAKNLDTALDTLNGLVDPSNACTCPCECGAVEKAMERSKVMTSRPEKSLAKEGGPAVTVWPDGSMETVAPANVCACGEKTCFECVARDKEIRHALLVASKKIVEMTEPEAEPPSGWRERPPLA
jgi:hypothetical protein